MKRIIDKRIREKFMTDDAYLNGQARICGWQATLAYNSLCRHANIDQESFPSIKLMSEELAVSRETIMKGIGNLEKYNVIQVRKNRTKGGQWLNNTYILIDKSQWIKPQVANTDLVDQVATSGIPSGSQPLDQVANTDTKETHKQGNTYKETHTVVAPDKTFVFEEELEKLKNSKQRIEKITALYWSKKGFRFTNMPQLVRQLLRDKKAAKGLEGYTGNEIAKTMQHCQDTIQAPYTWTLETVGKKIAEVINKK